MRKKQLETRVRELEFQLKMSERKGEAASTAANTYRIHAEKARSKENTYGRALELMKLREELSFERALESIREFQNPTIYPRKESN